MPHTDISPAEQKAIMKEALQEWLDRQFALVGRWTIAGLASMALAGLVYLAVQHGAK